MGLRSKLKSTIDGKLKAWRKPPLEKPDILSLEEIIVLHRRLIQDHLTFDEAKKLSQEILSRGLTPAQYIHELTLSAHFLRASLKISKEVHLNYINWARIQMISELLPNAESIVDLGGANGNLYDYGYPHKFDRLLVVDLPPENRHDMYKHLELEPKITPNGPIHIKFGDLSELEFIDDHSVSLVWSGQSIEHVSQELARKTYKAIRRILKPGGQFCLDTPNRLLTKIHVAGGGSSNGFIHPDHKYEYTPQELSAELELAGFKILERKGVCEMPNSARTGEFDYSDFVLGRRISDDIDASYIQYYRCSADE